MVNKATQYKPVLNAIASALLLADATNTFFLAADAAKIINVAADIRDEACQVTEKMVKAALARDGDRCYSLNYCDLVGIDVPEQNKKDILFVYSSFLRARGTPRISAVGRFLSKDDKEENDEVKNRASLRNMAFTLPATTKSELVAFLPINTALKKKNEVGAKKRKEREEEERLQQQISQRRAEAEAKRRRLEQSEALLRDQYNKLKADLNAIEARKADLTKEAAIIFEKLENARREYATNTNRPKADNDVDMANEPTQHTGDNTHGDTAEPILLLYILEGRAGKVTLGPNGVLFHHDLKGGLEPLPDGELDDDATRANKNYDLANRGKGQTWMPRGAVLKAKNKLGAEEHMANFRKLFSKKYCDFTPEERSYLAACGLRGYGCSDEAMIGLILGTLKVVVKRMGVTDITNLDLSQAVPSRATLATDECVFAADCVVSIRQELIDDEVEDLAGILTMATKRVRRIL